MGCSEEDKRSKSARRWDRLRQTNIAPKMTPTAAIMPTLIPAIVDVEGPEPDDCWRLSEDEEPVATVAVEDTSVIGTDTEGEEPVGIGRVISGTSFGAGAISWSVPEEALLAAK
ncbi:hypothetical protein BGX29_011598 [Mortierella sp. GBA35]|nr:hypothetical protein BGX29_011598 [Mortierella sp. GBA35]